MSQQFKPPIIYGHKVDEETRCVHWASELDIVALQFYCCRKFYPCYECHHAAEAENHRTSVWPKEERQQPTVLCGHCKRLLSIQEYIEIYQNGTSTPQCPSCEASFNPGCKGHLHLYFKMDSKEDAETSTCTLSPAHSQFPQV
jgi:uncharacterized CHY-type Zn-finger protein